MQAIKRERGTGTTPDLVKRFASFYGPHKKLLVLDMSAAVIQALGAVFIGTILNYVLNRIMLRAT